MIRFCLICILSKASCNILEDHLIKTKQHKNNVFFVQHMMYNISIVFS